MPLWWDMLKTPMAAPETRALRRRRFASMALCIACAATLYHLPYLLAWNRLLASCLICGLIIVTAATVLAYGLRKSRADNAYLDDNAARRSAPE